MFRSHGSGLRQGFASALFGLGLLGLVVAPSRGAFPPVPVDLELDRVAQQVKLSSGRVTNSCALGALPGWLRGYSESGAAPSPALLPSQHQALEQVAGRDHSPVRRALAALWLGNDLSEQDLAVLEPLLADDRPALPLPTVQLTQAVLPCYPVSWSPPLTVAESCRRALSAALGIEVPSDAAYRKWRADNPQPFASVDYFAARLRGLRREQALAVFGELARHPAVLARVLLVRLPPALSDLTLADLPPAEQALVVRELPPERVLRLLRRQELWPELASEEGLDAFAQRIFRRPDAFIPPALAPQVLDLWDKDRTRAVFVRAAIDTSPSQRPRIIRQTLAALGERSLGMRADLIGEFASHHYRDGLADLQGWFLLSRLPNVEPQAVLRGLAAVGHPALRATQALVLDPRFGLKLRTPPGISAEVAEALVDLSGALGARLPCPERSAFRVPAVLPVKSKAPVWSQSTAPSELVARAARRACAQRVIDWLRTAK